MLSAYGTTEQMRVTFKDYQVVDFFPKHLFDNEIFLENLRQIFSTEVHINLELAIHWQQGSTPEQAVLNMEIAGTRIKRNSPLQQRTALELDDLLCRLFYKAQSIIVQPLIPGLSGARVLQVHPFFAGGGGRAVVVKFGNAEKIEGEHDNFKNYIQSFLVEGARPSLKKYVVLLTWEASSIRWSELKTIGSKTLEFLSTLLLLHRLQRLSMNFF